MSEAAVSEQAIAQHAVRRAERLDESVLREVLDGALYRVPAPELTRDLRDFTLEYLKRSAKERFDVQLPDELDTLHEHLSPPQLAELYEGTYAWEGSLTEPPRLIARWLDQAGLASTILLGFKEHLRLVSPGKELLSTLRVAAHRDSWYCLPADAINVWIPCTQNLAGVGLNPTLFRSELSVGPIDPDTRHNAILDRDLHDEPVIESRCPFGEVFLFCSNQLHFSMPNPGPGMRVSWDYRLLFANECRPNQRLGEFVHADSLLESDGAPSRSTRYRTSRRMWSGGNRRSATWHALGTSPLARRLSHLRAYKTRHPERFFS
ncbi:MAG: hypothetical protein AAF533_20230 [Acidobacteriota bacterium]